MLWSADPALQGKWERAGASGDPAPNAIKVAALNSGGDKLDHFLHIDVGVVTRTGGVTLAIEADNTVSPDEVSYILGRTRPGHYSGHLVVNVPAAAPVSVERELA